MEVRGIIHGDARLEGCAGGGGALPRTGGAVVLLLPARPGRHLQRSFQRRQGRNTERFWWTTRPIFYRSIKNEKPFCSEDRNRTGSSSLLLFEFRLHALVQAREARAGAGAIFSVRWRRSVLLLLRAPDADDVERFGGSARSRSVTLVPKRSSSSGSVRSRDGGRERERGVVVYGGLLPWITSAVGAAFMYDGSSAAFMCCRTKRLKIRK